MCNFLQSDNPERICVKIKPQKGVTLGFSPLTGGFFTKPECFDYHNIMWDMGLQQHWCSKLGKLHCTIKSVVPSPPVVWQWILLHSKTLRNMMHFYQFHCWRCHFIIYFVFFVQQQVVDSINCNVLNKLQCSLTAKHASIFLQKEGPAEKSWGTAAQKL